MTKTTTDDHGTEHGRAADASAPSRQDAFEAVVAYSERLAHDANNYIGAILGLSEVLPAIADDPEQVSAIAARIAAAGRLLQVVVNQALLPVARHDDNAVLETEAVADIAGSLAAHLVGPRVNFSLENRAESGALALSAGEVSVLLFTLLRNAVDAIDLSEGAAPTIRIEIYEVEAGETDRYEVLRGSMPEGRVMALRVSDNGCGMKALLSEDEGAPFRPFVTRCRRRTALGLGLTFALAIAERRGGALALAHGEATEVTAYLPMGDAAMTRDAALTDAEGVPPQVVIVDPLMHWGAATATLLGHLDWTARQVGTVDDAVAMLDAASRERHVVVIRGARKGLSAADAARLSASFQRRFNVDLLLSIGATNALAADEEAAALLGHMAALALSEDAAPADIVNYLIPNI